MKVIVLLIFDYFCAELSDMDLTKIFVNLMITIMVNTILMYDMGIVIYIYICMCVIVYKIKGDIHHGLPISRKSMI